MCAMLHQAIAYLQREQVNLDVLYRKGVNHISSDHHLITRSLQRIAWFEAIIRQQDVHPAKECTDLTKAMSNIQINDPL